MLSELYPFLEQFLGEEIILLPRGHHEINNIKGEIPLSWESVLLSDMSLQSCIKQIWNPLGTDGTQMSVLLGKRIRQLMLVASKKDSLPLGLLYLFQRPTLRGNKLFSWLGGLPVSEESVNQFLDSFQMQPPDSYYKFSQIHNGFLQDGWSSLGIRPINLLYRLSKFPHLNASGLDYDPSQMLAFCGDGSGNEQCYNLADIYEDNDYQTCDWDHESGLIGIPKPFWLFLSEFVAKETGAS